MMGMERRTLEALRLIATGRVTWSAHRAEPDFQFGRINDPDHEWRINDKVAKLAERLYERENYDRSDHGRVVLTVEGRRLLAELEAEAARG